MKLLHFTLCIFICLTTLATGHDFTFNHVTIKHPIIPVFGQKMKTAAGYMTVSNSSNQPEKILAVKTNFAKAMLHESSVDGNGVARMKHINEVLIPPNSTIQFEHGGLHIMFIRLEEQLEPFVDQMVTLIFEKAGEIEITFMVEESGKDYKMDMDHSKDN